jgi:hypothetical protein
VTQFGLSGQPNQNNFWGARTCSRFKSGDMVPHSKPPISLFFEAKTLKGSSTANTAICIAGAYRSGTSMLTGLLHYCGLYLGPESELMPAQGGLCD